MSSSDAASNPHPEIGGPSEGSRRPIYKTETTGNHWQDVWIAFKRISVVDDFQRLGEMPCARNSLLSGIASGAGVGFIRAMSASMGNVITVWYRFSLGRLHRPICSL
ncbi:hypothetical protein J3R83DRAFT_12987 [Lanmaoa asiatica]|nr:hypothetical protein J3R83DRAFT_12987 [Lanmaoa asiatica]